MNGKQTGFLINLIACLIVTCIVVPLRCFVRRKAIARLAVEDWIMVAAQLLFVWEIVGCFQQLGYGMGKHMEDIDPDSKEQALMLLFIGTLLYTTVMMLARLSIGMLLLRLMASRAQKIAVWAVMTLNVATWVSYFIWTFFICKPVEGYWKWSTRPIGHCHNDRYSIGTYVHSGSAVITDWTLSIIPMWVLYKSNLPRKTRIATAFILSLGAFASTATVVRLTEVKSAADKGMSDFIYAITGVLTWSIAEQGLTILAACLATLRPLFYKGKRTAETSESTRGRTGRPRQPGDTQVDWDPGLTIGYIASIDEEEGRFDKRNPVRTATMETIPDMRASSQVEEDEELKPDVAAPRSVQTMARKEGFL